METYTINDAADLGSHLTVSHIDLTGEHEVAVCTNGVRIAIGVPLCSGCDHVVAKCECGA
jgi:hypothetical protein